VAHEVTHVRGTAANPMTEDEVAAKAADLMEPVLGAARAGDLIGAILGLEALDDCRALRPLLTA
ncbi:MAG: MmgE/PrpD family protein, partial [Proteobacteria bacterium]|nr:MmgE/PrpD family protein [Pseudomonadota bacterium]